MFCAPLLSPADWLNEPLGGVCWEPSFCAPLLSPAGWLNEPLGGVCWVPVFCAPVLSQARWLDEPLGGGVTVGFDEMLGTFTLFSEGNCPA